MADDFSDYMAARAATPEHPLLGLTILVVEDSRFACEAMRLLCLRSGARIRRADTLRAARRHLTTYRPNVIIVDLGLPDGSGTELIQELDQRRPRVAALLATSGDPDAAPRALTAGADGFLEKPIESLTLFRQAILGVLEAEDEVRAPAARIPAEDRVTPDRLALRDDLALAASLLDGGPDTGELAYLAQFLSGVALAAHDRPLQDAARALTLGRGAEDAGDPRLSHVATLVRDRLVAGAGF